MAVIKKSLDKYRYGLFFFAFLIVLSIINYNEVFQKVTTGLTYSIYAVDFSFGFCTRLLPGAIFNLIFNSVTPEKVCIYINLLLIFCFGCVSLLAYRLLESFNNKEKLTGLVTALLAGVTFLICITAGDFADILDFHWIIATVLFMCFLANRYTYFLIPLLFVFCVMSHYGSMICYIPMFVLILIFKILFTSEKAERITLIFVLSVGAVASAGMFIYMLSSELQNVNYSLEEFTAELSARGVTEFEYYVFPFFRETADLSSILGEDGIDKAVVAVDLSQSWFTVLLQTVVNQIQIHIALWNHPDILFYLFTFLPIIIIIYSLLISLIISKEAKALKKLVSAAVMLLPVFTIVSGMFMSTDTIRWLSHGILVLTVAFCYLVYKDEGLRNKLCSVVLRIPSEFVYGYMIIYSNYLFIV